MPRNTFIFVVVLTIFAALVTAVNLIPKKNEPTFIAQITPTPSIEPNVDLKEYMNKECGISFLYPTSLTEMESATRSAIFINSNKPTESIVFTCQKDIPRVPLPDDKIEKLLISSISAELYHDASAKDGTPVDKLIFYNPKTKLDIFIAGYGEIFNSIIASLKLLSP